MSFELTDEQDMLRQTIRDFAKNEIAPQAMERSAKEEFSIDLVHKMGELGLFGMTVSPDDGGQGLDTLSYVIAVEEIARVDGSAAATVAAGNSLGLGPIAQFGSKEQKQKYLPDLVTGKRLWSFGLTEPEAGSDAGSSKTTAVLERGQWVINGSKIFITNGSSEISAGCTVQAITGKKGEEKEISCILVEQETPGFTAKTMHNKLVWRASNTAELYFDDVKVPEKNLLGGRGQGFRQMLKTLDGGRLGIAAMALGGAEGAFEAALKYADERKTFGKPIKKHQAIAFKLADMATQIEAGRHLLYKGCWLKDQGKPFGKEAAMAKLFCSEMMGMVVDQAVQIHGGYGLMEEYPVARFYRDHKLLEIGEGSSEVQRIVISRHLGC
ncbi:MAG: acyl-CoA dehydrogenase [Deltaproteobacteria bacterium RIFCSPLOWO2_12_FULL_50_11]|nr:MAG: acyl-CoA dehydrogenase [Deltaproteobacteria bacterium GWA2_50_8]OGQ29011.1 MAG: acyl-CoA dehydrogenase [Deltaproteobacteria bacterium RIFCSPHIGHO2_02_FULL_50_15]OGQ68396.1 MAG: acyl-CoA dehydrogenase [Deltaproteobacteria bacterium RIFCSPLOWO2_12_FULL_50_11]